MIWKVTKHEVSLFCHLSKSWYFFAAIFILFSLLYKWLLQQYLELSQGHMLEQIYTGATEEIIHPFFGWVTILSLIIIPLVVCNSRIKDTKNKTMMLYKTAPSPLSNYLWGILISNVIMLCGVISIISAIPLLLLIDTNIDLLQYFSSYCGILLFTLSLVSISILAASLSSSFLMATGTSYLIIVSLSLLEWMAQFSVQHYMTIQSLGFLYPIKNLLSGNVFLIDIVYYLYISIISFGASLLVIENRVLAYAK